MKIKSRFYLIVFGFCTISGLYVLFPNCIIGRKNLSIGGFSRSIDESKKNGAFLFEYEMAKVVVYDSIIIQFQTAFAERNYRWKNYITDSLRFLEDCNIVILLDKEVQLPGYGEQWVIDEQFKMSRNKHCIYRIKNEESVPDTFTCYIREHKHFVNSLGNLQFVEVDSCGKRWPCDTIQSFQLIRKK